MPETRRILEPAPSSELRGRLLTTEPRPLPTGLRSDLESRTDLDLGHVRVHRGPAAEVAADAVHARAFTVGHHIVMGRGASLGAGGSPSPLLAHELGHVIEQRAGGSATGSAERVADVVSDSLIRGDVVEPENVPTKPVDIARQKKSGTTLPALSADELLKVVGNQRGFVEGTMPKGKIDPEAVGPPTGKGYTTHAAVQILDGQGRQVHVGTGAYLGGGRSVPHGEAGAIKALRAQLRGVDVRGGTMMVAVEQVPCPRCDSQLRALAKEHGLKRVDVYVPSREKVRGTGRVKPKTAARSVHQGRRPPTKARLHSSITVGGAKPPTPAGGAPGRPVPKGPSPPVKAAPKTAPVTGTGAAKFKISGRVLSVLRGVVFTAGLAAIGASIRKALNEKAFERLFNKMLAAPKTSAAIDRAYRAARSSAAPTRPRYLHIEVSLQFLGTYEPGLLDSLKIWKEPHEHESLKTNLESIFDISFRGVSVTALKDPVCGTSSWSSIPGTAAMYRHQDCTFPFSIDPALERRLGQRQAARARRARFDACVALELQRPGGLPKPSEIPTAQEKCAKKTEFSLAELAK